MAKKKDEGACYFRLPKTLKASGKERAARRDMTMAQHIRALLRDDLEAERVADGGQ